MGLEIPDEVKWLSWIVGQDWPEGDETAMRRLATAWQDAATGVDELTGDLQSSAGKVLSVVEGPAADRFQEFWDKFVTTDPQYLPKLAETCRALAKQCDDGANEIEYGKYMFIALLIVTAIQIAILIANMIETFGASAAGIPVAEGAAQLTARQIAQKILTDLLKSVALAELQSVGLDVLVQGIQVAEGHRRGGAHRDPVPHAAHVDRDLGVVPIDQLPSQGPDHRESPAVDRTRHDDRRSRCAAPGCLCSWFAR